MHNFDVLFLIIRILACVYRKDKDMGDINPLYQRIPKWIQK